MKPIRVVFVVDAEPRRREALAKTCAREGVEVIATGDPFEAIARVGTVSPDLFVLSTELGQLMPAELLAALRRTGSEAVPIAIGTAAMRSSLLHAGAAEVLAETPSGRELLWLALLQRSMRWQRAEASLAELPLGDVLRALFAAGRSARISVERSVLAGAPIRGELRLLRGELSMVNVGRLRGAKAMAHLLVWDEARIEVSYIDPEAGEERRMNKATEVLLDEGERFALQFRKNARQVGGTSAVYRQDSGKVPAVQGRIPAQVLEFLDRYDGLHSVLDLIGDSPFQHFDTLMITYRLAELGAIVRVTANPQADAGPAFPVAAEPAFPVAAEPSFPVAAESSLADAAPVLPVAEEPTNPVTLPAFLVAAEPVLPVAAEPSLPVAAESSLPVAAEPVLPVAAEAALPVAQEPPLPVAAEPAMPAAEKPLVPVAAKPEAPVAEKAVIPVSGKVWQPIVPEMSRPFFLQPTPASTRRSRRGSGVLVGSALADMRAAVAGTDEPIAPAPLVDAASDNEVGEHGDPTLSSGVPVAISAVQTLPFELMTEEELGDEKLAEATPPQRAFEPPPLPVQKPPPVPAMLVPRRASTIPPIPLASATPLADATPKAQAPPSSDATPAAEAQPPSAVPTIIVSWGSARVDADATPRLTEQAPAVVAIDAAAGSVPILLEMVIDAAAGSVPILLEMAIDAAAGSVPILLEAASAKTAPRAVPAVPVAAVKPPVASDSGATPRPIPPSLEKTQPIHVYREALKAKEAAASGRAREAAAVPAARAADRAGRVKREATGRFVRSFDPVEEDFFARERELLNVEEVDHFEDLIAEPVPESESEVENLRRWLPFGTTKKSGGRGRKR